ncbi:MAG: GNAT family N-acyltransferase [Thermoanaerobaculia bacterium]|nr:GNAT family N-acyltransferase [Thermoanaerobaculia bacterium]
MQRASTIDRYPIAPEQIPERELSASRYLVRFARSPEELDEILRLRFEVFNLEMGEGLDSSFETGRDQDEFDAVCHHLMVIERETDRVVGSYRVQTWEMARDNLGFYSATEFDLQALPPSIRDHSVEIGRACVAKTHRSTRVLFQLWKGLALYVTSNAKRYVFGCASLTSQDPHEGKALMDFFEREGHLHPDLTVHPQPGLECYDAGFQARSDATPELPMLLRTYLRHGAKVCGPPAVDRLFKTIDYFVVIDAATMSQRDAFFE